MKIVLDVNVILSALIRDSTTRKIILTSGFDFYFPEHSLRKISKYKDYVLEKSGMAEEEYDKTMTTLFKHIKLVPAEETEKSWGKAMRIMAHIDEEDVVFVATALSMPDSVIWSNDKDFESQGKVKVLKTKEMAKF